MSELREVRVSRGFTTREVAEKAGMTAVKYNGIERGTVPPNESDMTAIRAVLGDVKFFTAEEIEAKEKEFEDHLANMIFARAAIMEDTGGKRSVGGSVTCPKCAGILRYSVASNGHVHANCSTGGCLSWME